MLRIILKERFTAKMETGSLKKQLIVNMIYSGSIIIVKIFRYLNSQ